MHKAVQELVHAHENHGQHILLVGHGCSVEAAYLSLDPSAPHKFPRYCRYPIRASAAAACVTKGTGDGWWGCTAA